MGLLISFMLLFFGMSWNKFNLLLSKLNNFMFPSLYPLTTNDSKLSISIHNGLSLFIYFEIGVIKF
ncbi:hypothetical protein A0H76_3034 [Hepatospora eriocheir]|uniref:Uncharacterized protein n=1 Tax=Hepatospora eriocheir TaxID=1081669 RepID=A0A1X0QH99_9MICR|nr:hypothetical protein HERIO_2787 [Hepatospora eriocheir]ORD99157.1 hypothetical protein A0H76_3034 [Hepatospora eriocheir]